MAAFITPAEFFQFVDYRIIADLVQDADNPPSYAELLNNPVVLRMLNTAAGDIVLACVPAQRYSDSDLAQIAASLSPDGSLSPSADALKSLNAHLATAKFYERRQYPMEEIATRVPSWIGALEMLEMLRNGNRVFDNQPQVNAGVDFTAPIAGDVQLTAGHVKGGVDLMSGITRCFGNLNNSPR